MARLNLWSLGTDAGNPYQAPELQRRCLQGFVYDHPSSRIADGSHIKTSEIVDLDIPNRRAKTASGTEYTLGEPHPDFIQWLKDHGFNYEL